MNMKQITLAILMLAPAVALSSEEDFLDWEKATIQCNPSVSCSLEVRDGHWRKFQIRAFGKTNDLTEADLEKLNGFPLSSLRTTHEAGYPELGGYTIHFSFWRTYYENGTNLVHEKLYVSVTTNGVQISK